MAKSDGPKPHIGFAGFFVVITLGFVLMLLNVGISLGLTMRIPTTNANLTAAGCLGEKNKALASLPSYVRNRLGSNQDFINHSMTMTVGPIEGCEMAVIGYQNGAPSFSIHIAAK